MLWLTPLANGLTGAAVVAFLLALSGTLGPLPADAKTGAPPPDKLAQRFRELQTLLFAAAALLVAGVIEINALYSWLAAFVDTNAYLRQRADLPKATTASAGVFFTVLLAAAYAPALAVIRARARAVVDKQTDLVTEAQKRDWLEKNGLTLSVPQQASTFLAVLGPMLAGSPFFTIQHLFS